MSRKDNDEFFGRGASQPLYLCDQSAVRIMVKAVTEGPSPLGAWVQQQIADGHLWECTAVDAVPGWKVLTPDPRSIGFGRAPPVRKALPGR